MAGDAIILDLASSWGRRRGCAAETCSSEKGLLDTVYIATYTI
jgi:hypothetical protein